REAAGNLSRPADDRLADHGRGDHLVVEHDRKQASDVLLRNLGELTRAGIVELEVDDRLAGALIETGLCVSQFLARYDDALFQKIGLLALAVAAIEDLGFGRRPSLQRLFGRHGDIDEAKGERCDLADDFEKLLGIVEARYLHQDTIIALALDRGL